MPFRTLILVLCACLGLVRAPFAHGKALSKDEMEEAPIGPPGEQRTTPSSDNPQTEQEKKEHEKTSEEPKTPQTYTFAVGLDLSSLTKDVYGDGPMQQMSYGIVGQLYLPISGSFWTRFGTRIHYAREQAEMPAGLKVIERDIRTQIEASLLYNSFVIPSLQIGTGLLFRDISLETADSIDTSESRIPGRETLPFAVFGAGLGIPFWDGRIVLEPALRYYAVPGDARLGFGWGIDATWGF